MNKKMAIYLSPTDNGKSVKHKDQTVSFVNVIGGAFSREDGSISKIDYKDASRSSIVLLNYDDFTALEGQFITINLDKKQGYTTVYGSDALTLDVFRQEVDRIPSIYAEDDSDVQALTTMEKVVENQTQYTFRDYNVSNGRKYRYIIYPTQSNKDTIDKTVKYVSTNWQYWSITELYPTDETYKKFTAKSDEVWLFNLNVETDEQTQNFTRQEQETLGTYSRFSAGRKNYVSGSVSCLLGRDVIPAYLARDGKGGYTERLWNDRVFSSNEKIDMLLAWRKLVFSGNPKLLKDRAGQSFIVTITQSSNKPNDAVRMQPNTINFSWTEIMSLKDVTITENTLDIGTPYYSTGSGCSGSTTGGCAGGSSDVSCKEYIDSKLAKMKNYVDDRTSVLIEDSL